MLGRAGTLDPAYVATELGRAGKLDPAFFHVGWVKPFARPSMAGSAPAMLGRAGTLDPAFFHVGWVKPFARPSMANSAPAMLGHAGTLDPAYVTTECRVPFSSLLRVPTTAFRTSDNDATAARCTVKVPTEKDGAQ